MTSHILEKTIIVTKSVYPWYGIISTVLVMMSCAADSSHRHASRNENEHKSFAMSRIKFYVRQRTQDHITRDYLESRSQPAITSLSHRNPLTGG